MLKDSHRTLPRDDHGAEDGHVWETIQTFETILELFPEDKNALESLSAAYEQNGDTVRAQEMSLRLARLLASGSEWRRVLRICEKLVAVNDADPEVLELYEQAKKEVGTSALDTDTPQHQTNIDKNPSFDLQSELELAWLLLQHKLIDQALYEKAIARLTELRISSADKDCLSLLIYLEEQNFDTQAIIDFMAQEASCPYLAVNSFSLRHDLVRKLSPELCRRFAIIPLAEMGNVMMLGCLNPFAREHQERLRDFFEQDMRFFLTSPAEMKQAFAAVLFNPDNNQ